MMGYNNYLYSGGNYYLDNRPGSSICFIYVIPV